MIRAIQIDKSDNVAMVTASVEAGQEIIVTENGQIVKSIEPIDAGHKVALVRLESDETVVKYGIPIGRMKSPIDAGGWISAHNLSDTTEELCGEYCRQFRDGERKVKTFPPKDSLHESRMINAYPRADGSFGIRNYIMVISTAPACNEAAEAISDRTGCAWFVCDRTRLIEGQLTDYTRKAMALTGCNPNIYAVLVIVADATDSSGKEIFDTIAQSGKPVRCLSIGKTGAQSVVSDGISIIEDFQKEAAKLQRSPVSMEGFGLSVHCSGSDWATAINGNSSLGAASDLVVKNGGRVFMTEWMEWSGSQHLMAEKCATYELGLELLDNVEAVRATVLRETGRPVEYMNPAPGNILAGLTTLVEKSTGTIRKIGSTQIQGILEYGEKPTGAGVWLPKHDSVWPPTTAIYGAMSGAHMNVLVSGLGDLYFELPHMLCIRATGNPSTYQKEELKLDFNAGIAFEGKSIAEVGEILFEYLLRIAEGEEDPKSEHDKIRAFNMYYYTENEFGEGIDRSRILPVLVRKYHERCKQYTDNVK